MARKGATAVAKLWYHAWRYTEGKSGAGRANGDL